MRLFTYLSSRPPVFFYVSGTALVLLIGLGDYEIGHGISFSIFYLIPILILVWFGGRVAGIYTAVLSAAIWFTADTMTGGAIGHPYVPLWNAVVRLGFFLIVVFLLDALKREQTSAREDYLTGLGNRRSFFERADAEIKRSARYGHSFTIAYIDVDHFKSINDRFGHEEGDRVLSAVARVIKNNIRGTDIGARLGGDEFAVLLPESGLEPARRYFSKLRQILSGIYTPDGRNITFSIGVVVFAQPPESTNAMIAIVDDVMYAAKKSGKDLVKYQVVEGGRGQQTA